MIDRAQWNSECDSAVRALRAVKIPNDQSREIIEALGQDGQSAIELTLLVLDVTTKAEVAKREKAQAKFFRCWW